MNSIFKKQRKGYDMQEVDAFVAASRAELSRCNEQAQELKKELDVANSRIAEYNLRQETISKSIISAVEKSEQMEKEIRAKYSAELEHLSAFHERWLGYYNKLIATYPISEELAGLNQFNRRMSEILAGEGEAEDKLLEAGEQFESEKERLKKRYIGFIPVDDEDELDGFEEFGGGDFNPEESIRQMLRRQSAEEERRLSKKPLKAVPKKPASTPAPAARGQARAQGAKMANAQKSDEGGFNFEEALNPTQSLDDILKDIGL